jgi:hypothetical protein
VAALVAAGDRLDEVLALLTAACQGALRAGWSADLQHRTLGIMFAGLRPAARGPRGW